MVDLTLSFASGRGDIAHNRREKNGNPRTYGSRERHDWNIAWNERDVDAVIKNRVTPYLVAYNAKMINQRRPSRTVTYEGWLAARTGNGKQKPYVEFVVQLGNKLTGCPYVHSTDPDVYPIDARGQRILPWQTRKSPLPIKYNGRVVESEMSKYLKKVYYDIVKAFERENEGMEIVGAYVHADEAGGVHLHLDCVCFSHTKNGIGIGLSKTACVAEILDKKGIRYGKTRKDNALKTWTARMREMCTAVAAKHGIKVIDGHCAGRRHLSTPDYIVEENLRNDYLDKMFKNLKEKEKELQRERDKFCQWYQRGVAGLDKRSVDLEEREAALDDREDDIKRKERELQKRVTEAQKAFNKLEYEASLVRSQQAANLRRETWLNDREADISRRESEAEIEAIKTQKTMQEMRHRLETDCYIAETCRKYHPEWVAEVVGTKPGRGREKE